MSGSVSGKAKVHYERSIIMRMEDSQVARLAARLKKIEDLLALYGVFLFVLSLFVWAVGAVFSSNPVASLVANLAVTLLIIPVAISVLLYLVDFMRQTFAPSVDALFQCRNYTLFVVMLLITLLLIVLLILTVASATKDSVQRDALLALLALLLAWQTRGIIARVQRNNQENGRY
jgi:hypothetical protein